MMGLMKPTTCSILPFFVALLLGGCAQPNVNFKPDKSHHTPTGFKNNGTDSVVRPLTDLLRYAHTNKRFRSRAVKKKSRAE